MDRRDALRTIGALAGAGLAGCVSSGPGDGADDDGDGNDTADEPTGTDTPTPTATESPAPTGTTTETATESPVATDGGDGPVDATVETTGTECGTEGASRATVSLDGGRATFSGTLSAPDPGHSATIAETAYDPDSGALTVTLATESGEEPVVQCVGAIGFAGGAEVSGGTPCRVELRYDGRSLAVAEA